MAQVQVLVQAMIFIIIKWWKCKFENSSKTVLLLFPFFLFIFLSFFLFKREREEEEKKETVFVLYNPFGKMQEGKYIILSKTLSMAAVRSLISSLFQRWYWDVIGWIAVHQGKRRTGVSL